MLPQRFWDKVKVSTAHYYRDTPCWEWTGFINPTGYGRFELNGKNEQAHRLSYEEKYGKIPEKLVINHECRNRCCVNRENHLEAVTQKINIEKGLSGKINHHNLKKTLCPQGHKYSKENTYTRSNRISRECKICNRASASKSYYHKKLKKGLK